MMASKYSDSAINHALQTLLSIEEALQQLIEWNKEVITVNDFACSPSGMQLLAANAMLISAIGEGINKIDLKHPNFLTTEFPQIPWREIVGMRNHIVHGYFNLNADIVFDVVKQDVPLLLPIIHSAIMMIENLRKK